MRFRNNSGGMKYYKRRRPSIVVSILSLPRYSELSTCLANCSGKEKVMDGIGRYYFLDFD